MTGVASEESLSCPPPPIARCAVSGTLAATTKAAEDVLAVFRAAEGHDRTRPVAPVPPDSSGVPCPVGLYQLYACDMVCALLAKRADEVPPGLSGDDLTPTFALSKVLSLLVAAAPALLPRYLGILYQARRGEGQWGRVVVLPTRFASLAGLSVCGISRRGTRKPRHTAAGVFVGPRAAAHERLCCFPPGEESPPRACCV